MTQRREGRYSRGHPGAIQDVCSHKATQRFLSEQVQPSVRQPFPEPFHVADTFTEVVGRELYHRFGETRSQRHIGQYDVVARYDVVIDILEAETHAFPRAEDMDYAQGMLHDIEVPDRVHEEHPVLFLLFHTFPLFADLRYGCRQKPRNVKIYPPIL